MMLSGPLGAYPACPDGTFPNATAATCDPFFPPGSGPAPAALAPNVPLTWWQWVAIAGALGLSGVYAVKLYKKYGQR